MFDKVEPKFLQLFSSFIGLKGKVWEMAKVEVFEQEGFGLTTIRATCHWFQYILMMSS